MNPVMMEQQLRGGGWAATSPASTYTLYASPTAPSRPSSLPAFSSPSLVHTTRIAGDFRCANVLRTTTLKFQLANRQLRQRGPSPLSHRNPTATQNYTSAAWYPTRRPIHPTTPPLGVGAMPVLHHLYQRAASLATDTRTLESRQLRALAHQAAQAVAPPPSPATLADHPPPLTLVPRQYNGQLVAIPYFYQYGGPAPAAVAGIVLGSVAGFLLLLWLFWTLSNGSGFIRTSDYTERDRGERSSRSRRSSRQTNTELRSRSPPRRERVIRQERIVREVPVQRERESSRVRETVIIDDEGPPPMMRGERRVEGDDIAGLPLRGSRF